MEKVTLLEQGSVSLKWMKPNQNRKLLVPPKGRTKVEIYSELKLSLNVLNVTNIFFRVIRSSNAYKCQLFVKSIFEEIWLKKKTW